MGNRHWSPSIAIAAADERGVAVQPFIGVLNSLVHLIVNALCPMRRKILWRLIVIILSRYVAYGVSSPATKVTLLFEKCKTFY